MPASVDLTEPEMVLRSELQAKLASLIAVSSRKPFEGCQNGCSTGWCRFDDESDE